MPPTMMGLWGKLRRMRLQYTTVAWSGRLPVTPPGVKASVRRRFLDTE